MLPAAMPDITKAQVIAGLKFIFTLAAMLALPVPDNVREVAIASSGLIATAITVADAIIRGNRAKALAVVTAETTRQQVEEAYVDWRKGNGRDPVVGNTDTSAAKTPDTPPPPAFRDDAFTDVDPTQEDGIDLGDPAPESRPKAMSADEKAMTDLAGAEGGTLRSGE
jgi:hypothetical protein